MYSADLAGTAILASAPTAANALTYFFMVASSFCWMKSRRASDDALDRTEGKDLISRQPQQQVRLQSYIKLMSLASIDAPLLMVVISCATYAFADALFR